MSLDMADFYERCLMPLTPDPDVSRILDVLIGGGETTQDFVEVVSRDAEVQHWLRVTVKRLGFSRSLRQLSQIINLLGQNRVRDFFLGRHLERQFIPEDQTVLSRLKSKAATSGETSKKKMESVGSQEFEGDQEDSEIIPALNDFQPYLQYAIEAENVATLVKNSYPGQAYAGGILFDYCRAFLSKTLKKEKLTDFRLIRFDEYIDEIYRDGLRCAIAANEILQKISIPRARIVFVTALVHNIGKLLLLSYDPSRFEAAFLRSTGSSDQKRRVDSAEAEEKQFEMDHAQIGALYVARVPALADSERSIDYHHNPHLLKFSNPGLYALACILRVSGILVKLYEKKRKIDADIQNLRDQKLMAIEEFQYLKLGEKEWSDIKANYALKVFTVGL